MPKLDVANQLEPGGLGDADLDTLATAPHVTVDDLLKRRPEVVPLWGRTAGQRRGARQADGAVGAVGVDDEARWVRHVRA